MSQFERREALTERIVVKVTPAFKERVYRAAARKGRTVSDIGRTAMAAVVDAA
jgi:transposase-like protein